MAEPASSTAGVAIAAGTITLTGSILGVQYDALLAGFFGGLVSLSYLPAMPRAKIAGSVAGSSIIAGYFAPIIAAAAAHYLPWLASLGDILRLPSAIALGLSAQAVIPAVLNRIRKQGDAQ